MVHSTVGSPLPAPCSDCPHLPRGPWHLGALPRTVRHRRSWKSKTAAQALPQTCSRLCICGARGDVLHHPGATRLGLPTRLLRFELGGMSLASPSHRSIHSDVTWERKRCDGSLALGDCSNFTAHVSAAYLRGNLLRTMDLATRQGTSSLQFHTILRPMFVCSPVVGPRRPFSAAG